MSKIAELANAPEVSFIGYLTLDEVKQMVSDWYNEKYKELTGTAPVLGDAAPEKLLQLGPAGGKPGRCAQACRQSDGDAAVYAGRHEEQCCGHTSRYAGAHRKQPVL